MPKALRIAVVGTHSTGKTTLLRSLSKHLELPFISEVAREKIVESEKLPHLMSAEERADFQRAVLSEQIRRETSLEEGFLSDRSVFDAAAYAFDTPAFEEITAAARTHYSRRPYDRIFFLPVEFGLEGDDIRSEDEDYRRLVEDRLRDLLSAAGIETVSIRGTHERRVSDCLRSLGIDFKS